jgi:hypothetical protein
MATLYGHSNIGRDEIAGVRKSGSNLKGWGLWVRYIYHNGDLEK